MNERGTGSIYTRERSQYFWLSYSANGEKQREVARFVGKGKNAGQKIKAIEANYKEAERALKLKLDSVTAARVTGQQFIGPQQQRLTVGDLLDGLEQDYKLRDKWGKRIIDADGTERWQSVVASHLKPLREHFGAWRAVDVTSDSVAEYIEQLLSDEYSPATINRRTQLLGQAFTLAVRTRKLASVPYIQHLSEVGNERQGFFEEIDSVIPRLPGYLRDFTRFGFLTGWRKGSIQKLRWCDVSDDVIYLRAKHSKTRKPETVPLQGELAELIKRRRVAIGCQDKDGQAHISEYVFHLNGEPIGEFRKSWARACCAAGVGAMVCPQCNSSVTGEKHECAKCNREWKSDELVYVGRIFHDLRRTAARNMVAAGVPPQVAMKITGHRTDAMFRRYAIVNEDQKRDALTRTAAYLAATANRKVLAMASNR